MEVKNIPIGAVHPSPMNPRKTFDQDALVELADNIRQQGLLQPITIRPVDYEDIINGDDIFSKPLKYEIVCGERRFRAMSILAEQEPDKYTSILAIVRDMTDDEAFDAMITENLQRKDVDPIEEAFAFGQLIKKGNTAEEVALRFGKSVRFVQDRIKLNNLIPELLLWIRDGKMPIASGMVIAKIEEEEQKKFKARCDYMTTVPKETALNFVNSLFRNLAIMPWSKDKEPFDGGCGTTCAACSYNSCNAGCLFYEMNANPKDARCTNRVKFEEKQLAYLRHCLNRYDAELVKAGQPIEKGKIPIVDTGKPMNGTAELYERAKSLIVEMGYEIIEAHNLRKCWYSANDERVTEMLESGELIKTLAFFDSSNWIELTPRFYYTDNEDKADSKSHEELEAVRLAGLYGAALKEAYDGVGKAMGKRYAAEPPSSAPFTAEEETALLTLMLVDSSNEAKRKCGIQAFGTSEMFEFVRDHPEQHAFILREHLKEMMQRCSVYYNASSSVFDAARHLGEAMYPHEYEQTMLKAEGAAEKKQAKIKDQLAELGYDTEGKPLEYKETRTTHA